MAPLYAIIFMDSLEEDILSNSLVKPLVWWSHIYGMFLIWGHGQEELQKFLIATIKSIAEYSWAKKYFLDVTCMKKGNQLITDFYVKPTDTNRLSN